MILIFITKNTLTQQIKEGVIRLITNGVKDVYLKGVTSIPDSLMKNREGRLDAKITLGEIIDNEEQNTTLMPGEVLSLLFPMLLGRILS